MTRKAPRRTPSRQPGGVVRYRDHILEETRHDPYQEKGKYHEPTVCGHCGAVFASGRWRWGDAPGGAHTVACPACRRSQDQLAAGFVTLEGEYLARHRDELLALAQHAADAEQKDHPMHRIMRIEDRGDRIVITTTDLHLPRRIGRALEGAHGGRLKIDAGPDEYLVRVHWIR